METRIGSAIDATTLGEALRLTARDHPDVVAVRTADDMVALTWGQVLERVDRIAAGYASRGIKRGDTVALMLTNRPEFNLLDWAAVTLGAVPFSIYNTYPADQVRHLLEDSDAKLIATEQVFLPTVQAACRELDIPIVVIDGDAPEGSLTLQALEDAGEPAFDAEAAARGADAEDLVTLIYTSGTTGPPKGVQITHRNVMSGARAVEEIITFPAGSRVISWLPAAHIAERMAHHYIPTVYAGTITVCPDPRQIVAFLPQVRPHWFFAVPRIWEKLKLGLEAMRAGQPEEARAPLEQALQASLQRVRLRQRREPVPEELEQAWEKADREIFSGLRKMLGLDELRAVNVGAAPTAVEVIEFFHALGIEIAELWGMSETCGAGICNRPGEVRIGSVGVPIPGVEVKLGEDGELLVRGPIIMPGYRQNPEKTAEALDADGWLHTGDIATIDDDGYVSIVDRKKELIISSAGKNMSPANIEAALKSSGPIIGQACVIGDARPYNTALIVLDPDFAAVWAAQHDLAGRSVAELVEEPALIEAVQQAVDAANENLARVEQIKRFTVVPNDWLPGGDELTPTMKLKRRPISDKYASEIEAMYA